MDVPSPEPHSDSHSDQYPLLLEQMESPNSHVHIIDVTRNDDTSSSSSNDDQPPRVELPQHEDRLSHITHAPTYQAASSNRLTSRSSSFMRRGDVYSRHRRSPLNSGLWISVELLVTVSQIIASIVVLSLSTNENPQAPLFAWIVGYASGCVATLPILYWRFRNRYRGAELESTESHQGSAQRNPPEPMSYTAISITPASHEETNQTSETVVRNPQVAGPLSARFCFPLPFISYFIYWSSFIVLFILSSARFPGEHA